MNQVLNRRFVRLHLKGFVLFALLIVLFLFSEQLFAREVSRTFYWNEEDKEEILYRWRTEGSEWTITSNTSVTFEPKEVTDLNFTFHLQSSYDAIHWSEDSILILVDHLASGLEFFWTVPSDKPLHHQWMLDDSAWHDVDSSDKEASCIIDINDIEPDIMHHLTVHSSFDGIHWSESSVFHFRYVVVETPADSEPKEKLPAVNTSDWNWALRAGCIQSIQYVNFLGDGDLNSWLGLGTKVSIIRNNNKNHLGFVLDGNIQYMKYGNGNYVELALMGKLRYTFREEDKKARPFIELGGGENLVFRDNGHKGFYPMVSADLGVDIRAKENLALTILGEYSVSFQRDKNYSPDDLLDSFNSHFSISAGLTYSFHKTEAKQ